MEEQASQTFIPPLNTNTFGIPNRIDIMPAYHVYKPSKETRSLLSEAGRTIFAEEFVEDPVIGPLSDLCVRALARGFGSRHIAPIVANDPLKLRVHYDSLDVDMPLADCYFISDPQFWRRVVIAKTLNKGLSLKKFDYPWKNIGVSMKYVELVEKCPAEYWPEEEMRDLALKVREFVDSMHIKKLQSLNEASFEEYFLSESSLGSDTSSDSSAFVTPELSKAESVQYDENGDPIPPREKTAAELEDEAIEREQKLKYISEMREEKAERRRKKEERRRRREAKRVPPPPPEPPKRRRKKRVRGVFEIEVEPEEEDSDVHVNDRRNLDKFLQRKRSYKYPPEHCHHIDLRFVGLFIYMTSFTIEFQGPDVQRDYHTRHFNFSYVDTHHLAEGLSHLFRLKTFRLINSRMDAKKLEILLNTLCSLSELEELDFKNDQLKDDCGYPLYHFFKNSSSLKRLELSRNKLGPEVLTMLAKGLRLFDGSLEYLGLAGASLADESFCDLVEAMIEAEQVSSLNIRASFISQDAIIRCVCKSLLREHDMLRELDMAAIRVGVTAAKQLAIAMNANKKVLKLDCRACEIDFDIEKDIAVLVRRNEYIAENPYIGNEAMTTEDIDAFNNRIKNPFLIKALEKVKEQSECLGKLPPDTDFVSSTLDLKESEAPREAPEPETDIWGMHKVPSKEAVEEQASSEAEEEQSIDTGPGPVEKGPFTYNPDEFNLEQFWAHLWVPGPSQRFFYFQAKNERHTHTQ